MGDAVQELIPYAKCEGKFIRVPKVILEAATRALRHYPTTYDIERSANKLPEIWGAVK
jgi:hypothetical protein